MSSKKAKSTRKPREESPEQRRVRIHQSVMGAKSGRYMVIRFLASALLFMNLFWAYLFACAGISLGIVAPLLGGAAAVCALGEAGRCVSHAEDSGYEYMAITHKAMIASCVLSGVVALATMLGGTGVFFPFFSTPVIGVVATLIACMLKLALIAKIIAVRDRTDKRYQTYLRYVKLAYEQKGR